MKTVMTLFLMTTILCVSAQTPEEIILDEFFSLFQKNPAEAIDYIYGLNKWIDIESEAVKDVKGKLSQSNELLGEYYGHEYVSQSIIADCFSVYIYLAKFDRQPLRFTFEFYKPKDKWMVYSFQFDDSFDDDMIETMKSDYLRINEKRLEKND